MNKLKMIGLAGLILVSVASIVLSTYKISQWKSRLSDWGNISYYQGFNQHIKNDTVRTVNSVVFMGNSIMEHWSWDDPEFFSTNKYICRGISGQTTEQMLLRFRQDVLEIEPKVVIIGGGINDISEYNSVYNEQVTLGNLKSMAELASANNIKVIMTTVPYTRTFEWNKKLGDVSALTKSLNKNIEEYAKQKGFGFVDIFSKLRTEEGLMNLRYVPDEVHPNIEGYALMKPLLQKAIEDIIK